MQFKHVYIHTYIHTHTHTQTHTNVLNFALVCHEIYNCILVCHHTKVGREALNMLIQWLIDNWFK